ncbi:M23 family metallopeptidase [Lachnospiraceae bacterium OttesenSCG-928-D06]|nr:M23 family metallopeptidase [Lachnospiraceae bacterium OttesenSCG-928-D06]
MRRNRTRKNNVKKERIIMIASSAFVLAALTMTGIYMKNQSAKSQDEGYSLDFAALENSASEKYTEIAKDTENNNKTLDQLEDYVTEDDLDYAPLEVDSTQIQIPGLTDQTANSTTKSNGEDKSEKPKSTEAEEITESVAEGEEEAEETEEVQVEETAGDVRTLSYDGHAMVRPGGAVLIPYSMSSSVYFKTLDQYKYHDALVLSSAEGESVGACADAQVVSVFFDEEIGNAITLDIGDGYLATYGQLRDIPLTQGSYVNAGELIGYVATPTKYFSLEGANVYFKLTKDGNHVNPEGYLQ